MKKQYIAAFLLFAYSVILVMVLVFKKVPMIRLGQMKLRLGGTHVGSANLIPFKSILSYLYGDRGAMIGGINLVGNIVLLVPIGLLIPSARNSKQQITDHHTKSI